MIGINNNLYPPIIDTYTPAFVYTRECNVYFDISEYNSLDQFHQTSDGTVDLIQVIVQHQQTNQSVLKTNLYPSGIKLTQLKIDEKKGYYITISASDIQNGFNLNQYYKVQIRFTAKNVSSAPSSSVGIDNWLGENLKYFSQWSSVTLIRGISQPTIIIQDLVGSSLKKTHLHVNGKVTFANLSDTEKLKQYSIQLYNSNQTQLLEDSGQLISTDNKILYSIKRELKINTNYKILVQITTSNFYQLPTPKVYSFRITDDLAPFEDIEVTLKADNEKGCIELNILNKNYNSSSQTPIENNEYTYLADNSMLIGSYLYFNFTQETTNPLTLDIKRDIIKTYGSDEGQLLLKRLETNFSSGMYILIRRTSSRVNFEQWEDLGTIPINSSMTQTVVWSDYTVEPGVWYKYTFIKCSQEGDFLNSYKNNQAIMLDVWDIFLSDKERQLKIKFDPQIASYSTKVSQSIVETLGSKYPFIRRNGTINYKVFTLSGTISAFMDIGMNMLQASKNNLYKDAQNLYYIYNQNNNITLHNDYIYEKFFREEVMKFLESNTVKLFRSLTEGNMLVKLSGVTFTPNMSLGRLVYSFSCTAYEIADSATAEDINKFQIMSKRNLTYK